MRLTTFTDYSLRLLMYLAGTPERRATVAEVAAAYGISAHHLTKVVHLLGREGILKNTRGRRGGAQLAREPDAINVGDVVRLTEGKALPLDCRGCAIRGACHLPGVLCEGMNAFYEALGRYTLEDLVASSRLRGQLLVQAPNVKKVSGTFLSSV